MPKKATASKKKKNSSKKNGRKTAAKPAPATTVADAAAAAAQNDSPAQDGGAPAGSSCCYVCLEGDGDPEYGQLAHGGCGCRGSAGRAHLSCLVKAAGMNAESWLKCPACLQNYTGRVARGLARARDEQGSTPSTKTNLAIALQAMGKRAEARRLFEEVLVGQTAQLGPSHTQT
eukprot:SAG22_NODE_4966_length_1121_cov_0.943249_2_plen_173_part_01